MSEERDLSEGFPEYHRPPRDVVPRIPLSANDIPTGDAEIVHYELGPNGVERVVERAYITAPFDPNGDAA